MVVVRSGLPYNEEDLAAQESVIPKQTEEVSNLVYFNSVWYGMFGSIHRYPMFSL